MALYFITDTPKKLLATFKKNIDDGHVITWEYDKDGDFTHVNTQWDREAWLRPIVERDRLTLHILAPKIKVVTMEIYAVYHGRFIESMIAHCHDLFREVVGTAEPTQNDKMKGSGA